MLSNLDMWAYVLVIAAAVFSTRALSFVLFPAGKETPKIILFLGNTLPCALMALLVVYCLKGVSLAASPHGIPEAIAIAVTAALHLWKRNTLLSMGIGTIVYMILVQCIF